MTSHSYIKKLASAITPEMRYDFKEDFNSWQAKASSKLKELLGLPLKKPADDNFAIGKSYTKDGLEFTHFSFDSEEGYTVPCCMVKKMGLSPKAPLALCLQGHSPGMHISLGEVIYERDAELIAGGRDFAVRTAREGMVAVAVENRYMGTKSSHKGLPSCVAANEDFDSNQAMAALLLGRTAIGERVWDASCTIDAVQKHFSDIVDFEKIICLGNSGGGTATFYTACCDERITVAVPSCSVCTFEDSIMAMNHCPCNFIPNIRKYFDMGDLCSLVIPRKLVIVCGKDDSIFPLHGVQATFELAKKAYDYNMVSDNIKLIIGNGGHRFYPDDAWPVIHELI